MYTSGCYEIILFILQVGYGSSQRGIRGLERCFGIFLRRFRCFNSLFPRVTAPGKAVTTWIIPIKFCQIVFCLLFCLLSLSHPQVCHC